MPRQRVNIEGEIYFVTTRTFTSKLIFSSHKNCELFLKILDFCRQKLKFQLYAYCVLPNHVHLLILPNKRNTISDVIRHIKGRFAKLYNTAEDEFLCYGNKKTTSSAGEEFILADKEDTIWQKSFYDKAIRSDEELHNVINYINNNALKHNLVDDSLKWRYSSSHNYEKTGEELIKIDDL